MGFKTSIRRAAALALCCACAPPAGQGAEVATDRTESPLTGRDSVLAARVEQFARARAEADSLSGIVVVASGDRQLLRYATGYADRSRQAAVDGDTRFNLASLDKFFTRIAIRQLQQQGRLSMDDVVGKHLPDYPNQRVRREVTIRHLYEMRSGMGDFGSDDYATMRARLSELRTLRDYLPLFVDDSLAFPPGTRTRYSNASYVVLGLIIERVTGDTYYDYVQRHIFDVAGMRRSGYFAPTSGDRNTAIGYTANPLARAAADAAAGTRAPNTALLAARGSSSGGGYSTANDLLALGRAVMGHELLDRAHSDSLLDLTFPTLPGVRVGGWAGGDAGVNTVFYLHSTGHVLLVLSNYDPPSATVFRRQFWDAWLPEWLRASP